MIAIPEPLIVANWKMNGLIHEVVDFTKKVDGKLKTFKHKAEVVFCPPFQAIAKASESVKHNLTIGAQDCFAAKRGAFTGDVNPAMLADVGCQYVIVGHSERREHHKETNKDVHDKVLAAHDAGLKTIVCIGESATQRRWGMTQAIIRRQLLESIPKSVYADDIVVAYEPIWAIGTGKTAKNEDIEKVHEAIRNLLLRRFGEAGQGVKILYGGSVNKKNAKKILALGNVDGVLVGGSSLKADDFWEICQSCP